MLSHYTQLGSVAACAHFGVKVAAPGLLSNLAGRAKGFGRGQHNAAQVLVHNLRGGLGGASNLGNVGQLAEGAAGPLPDISRLHRNRAVENIGTLTPSLLAGGGLYMLHKQRANQAPPAQDPNLLAYGGGYPQV